MLFSNFNERISLDSAVIKPFIYSFVACTLFGLSVGLIMDNLIAWVPIGVLAGIVAGFFFVKFSGRENSDLNRE